MWLGAEEEGGGPAQKKTKKKNIVETLNNELVQPTLEGEKSECV